MSGQNIIFVYSNRESVDSLKNWSIFSNRASSFMLKKIKKDPLTETNKTVKGS